MFKKFLAILLIGSTFLTGCSKEEAAPQDVSPEEIVDVEPAEPQIIKQQYILNYYAQMGRYAGRERTSEEYVRQLRQINLDSPIQTLQGLLQNYSEHCLECISQMYKEMDNYTANIPSGPSNPKPVEIQFILDASGSMAGKIQGEVKMEIAKNSINKFVSALPDKYKVALRVYGHKGSSAQADKEVSCNSTELLTNFTDSREKLVLDLKKVRPVGWTPISLSLEKAANDFSPDSNKIVFLVTDGIQTCDGDPVKTAEMLKSKGITVNVFGFDIADAQDTDRLNKIAKAGGGKYYDAKNGAQLDDVLNTARVEYERWEAYKNQLTKGYMEYRTNLVNIMNKYVMGNGSTPGCFVQRLELQDKNIYAAIDYLYQMGKIKERDYLIELYDEYKTLINELKDEELRPFQELINKSKTEENDKKQQIDNILNNQ